ncbi:zinc finger BED domain-containing protein RICESLEEPER 1-like [Bidens hawaiensis]|uniref:zinc finger BED domain-containing protein RICESLEEPER 1-like n=1 Tax=Bidens hawaiensis TaxID=980011 RepID=UPI00404AF66F
MDIYRHLRKMSDTDLESKLMADRMQDKFDKYWGTSNKGFNYILYFAAILDPRSKLRVLSFGFAEVFRAEKRNETHEQLKKRIETTVTFITDELEIMFKHYEYELNRERPSSSQASQRASKVAGSTDGSSSFFAQFKSASGSSSYETKTELQKYLDDIEEPDYEGFDILQWWKASSSKYPIVAKMAKDILAIPVSSVASESAFSTGGRVVEPYRSSLTPSIVEALICTGDWIGTSSKKIINESPTDFDAIGKEIYEKAEPGNMNSGV